MTETRYGRYLSCEECTKPILSEKDGFTRLDGRPICQMCGLKIILTENEWATIKAVKEGGGIIALRSKCSTLRTYPPNTQTSVVEFKSPDGQNFCIVRDW